MSAPERRNSRLRKEKETENTRTTLVFKKGDDTDDEENSTELTTLQELQDWVKNDPEHALNVLTTAWRATPQSRFRHQRVPSGGRGPHIIIGIAAEGQRKRREKGEKEREGREGERRARRREKGEKEREGERRARRREKGEKRQGAEREERGERREERGERREERERGERREERGERREERGHPVSSLYVLFLRCVY
ncbi:uncharacterized protein N7515_004169 [Penicillium bovifimosum]|uniref:Uncharacterized protein n=1 Tax=Penicillium bovifimosum TaxID=126998 RepID=A0A9W9L6F6_9EURO|nr:uncharacterized protein N7515_004169 [Penicillium bovifimosum]KAJ5139321.1 hypothetical protein N7515_004169 [Penicillium bovifimosum]